MNQLTPESEKLYLNGHGSNWERINLDHHDVIRRVISGELKAWLRVDNRKDIFARSYFRNPKGELLHEYIEWGEDGNERCVDQIPDWSSIELFIDPEDIQNLYQHEGPLEVELIQGKTERTEQDPRQPEISLRKIIEAEGFIFRLDDVFVRLNDAACLQVGLPKELTAAVTGPPIVQIESKEGLFPLATVQEQPTADQAATVVGQDEDKLELEALKTKTGAMESATLLQLCRMFDYGSNSQTGVGKKVDEYNSRFPEIPINFHKGKGRSKCLYNYEAWFIKSKIGGASGRRKSRKSCKKKT